MKNRIGTIFLWIALFIVLLANMGQEVEINKLKQENYELMKELLEGE